MKNIVKLLSSALIIVLLICAFTTVAFADGHSQTPNITSNEYFNQTRSYSIGGLRSSYVVPGNYIGYGYANNSYEVEAVQAGLEKVNFHYPEAYCDPQGVDGLFGSNTYYAIQFFQVYVGLSCDGTVGPNTWYQLESWTNNQH